MVDKVSPDDALAENDGIPPKRPSHRGADLRDTVAELTERAQIISQEAGTKVAAAMKDVISAGAGIAGFAIESARDLVQFMVRRGQMTAEEGDKLLRDAEEAHARRPDSEKARPTATKVAAERAAAARAESAARAAAAAAAMPPFRAAARPVTPPATTPKAAVGGSSAKSAGKTTKPAAAAKGSTGTKPAGARTAAGAKSAGSKATARPAAKSAAKAPKPSAKSAAKPAAKSGGKSPSSRGAATKPAKKGKR